MNKIILVTALVFTIIALVMIKHKEPTPTSSEIATDGSSAETIVSNTPGPTLDMSNQALTNVPMSVFKQTNTTALDLSHNQLTGALPAEVRHLQNLKILDLSDNNFTGVPAEIGQLGKLEVLDLSNNQLTGLPYELGNLANLQVLDLRGNQYSEQDLAIIKKHLPATTVIKTD